MRILVCLTILLASCTGGRNDLPEFNERAFRDDHNGCNRVREAMLPEIESALDKIKGMSENDILEVLGQPDHNELYKRNQKFYIYYITPSLECGETGQETQLFLEIRFSATNMAREVLIRESGR